MAAIPQRFPLPNMPFRRDLHNGCTIGESIALTAQAFQTKPESFTLQLTSTDDIAILVTVPIARKGQITATAQINGNFTGAVEKPIFLQVLTRFTLELRVTQYVIEILFNNSHLMDFVHRVSPTEIKTVIIEGPLIVDEVVFTPPQGDWRDPPPTYEQATILSTMPIDEFKKLNIGSSTISTLPIPAPRTISTYETVSTTNSTPVLPQIRTTASTVGHQPMATIPPSSQSLESTMMIGSGATLKDYNLENSSTNVPTTFQQMPNYPFPVTTTPFTSTSSENPQLPYPENFQPFRPTNFFANPAAQIQPFSSPINPNYLQSNVPQSQSSGALYTQRSFPQSYVSSSHYPYPQHQPYMSSQHPTGIQITKFMRECQFFEDSSLLNNMQTIRVLMDRLVMDIVVQVRAVQTSDVTIA
ncbi:galactoside-binding lectin [Dictyocaulus viviparus]|uniref:Galectin n=1 Tax=Dictyocaulus viviparus TaxID=29172 RepID=A0A0D8XPL1_DICVI|nr:galactoside-binding lectin [Dictyocaulus viviparus]